MYTVIYFNKIHFSVNNKFVWIKSKMDLTYIKSSI